jgi:hypothetical protein
MADKEEADGRRQCCDLKTEAKQLPARLGGCDLGSHTRNQKLMVSSIRSFQSAASKTKPLSKSKNKSTDTLPGSINRAIPGPGEEVEAEPDAGVVDSEKVSVVFLVRCMHDEWSVPRRPLGRIRAKRPV